jgi:hypothetical protein
MESSIRRTSRNRLPLASSVVGALAGLAMAIVAPSTAAAALAEYRVQFEPSASPGAVGYTLHIGTTSGDYAQAFDLGNPPSSGGTVAYAVDLEDSVDIYVALQAYDDAGDASAFSNEMRVAAVIAPPPPPPPPAEDPPPEEPPVVDPPEEDPPSLPPVEQPPVVDPPVEEPPAEEPPPEPTADPSTDDYMNVALATIGDGQIMSLLGTHEMSLLTIDSLAAPGDLRPVRCDLDGDDDEDLVIGFGAGSGGQVAALYLEDGSVVSSRSISTGTAKYRANPAAATTPACGDLDGDGLAEIVVGFGPELPRVVQVFDDASTGFAMMEGRFFDGAGLLKVQGRRDQPVALYPAVGDIDGDGRDELVVGSGPDSRFGLAIFDDARSGFKRHPAVEGRRGSIQPALASGTISSAGLASRPAVGDVDGDGYDEIVVAFGEGSAGQMVILDDARAGYSKNGSPNNRFIVAGRDPYRAVDGETHAAVGDLDGDGVDEIVVGFRRSSRNEVQIFDDLDQMVAPAGYVSVPGLDAPLFPSPAH